jgi:hypothetical protein
MGWTCSFNGFSRNTNKVVVGNLLEEGDIRITFLDLKL